MKRFLLALALVAVAGATYVATAPGSQTASPSARQFAALKKQVARLQKDEAKVKQLVYLEGVLITDCMQHSIPIRRYGDPAGTYGYTYSDPNINAGAEGVKTAFDVTANDDPNALWITYGTSQCATDLTASLHKLSRLASAVRR